MRRLLIPLFCSVAAAGSAQFKNIKLAEDDGAHGPVTASIAISYKDPNNMLAFVSSVGARYTTDGGSTWNESVPGSPFGIAGNPTVVSDVKGHFYVLHTSDPNGQGAGKEGWHDRIVCHKTEDGGKTWEESTFMGVNPPKNQDRPWATPHPKKQIVYSTWTQFDSYGIKDANCHSNILFSMSTNAGGKWSKPIQLNQTPGDCMDDGNTTVGSTMAVAMDGRFFATWISRGTIFFDRSYDGGETWLTNDIAMSKEANAGVVNIPGISRRNGAPVLMVNNSPNRTHGNLYLVHADQKNGENDTDIWFLRTVNRGDNWTVPLRINQDEPGKHQFMPWMTVDQASGYIFIVYYDRRAYDDLQTDVYLAYSTDGGNTFKETKISETPFIPTESKPFSEYTNVIAHNGTITPIWTRMDNGVTSVWTTVIKDSELMKAK